MTQSLDYVAKGTIIFTPDPGVLEDIDDFSLTRDQLLSIAYTAAWMAGAHDQYSGIVWLYEDEEIDITPDEDGNDPPFGVESVRIGRWEHNPDAYEVA